MLGAYHAGWGGFVPRLPCFRQCLFHQRIVGGQKLHWHAFDVDTLVLLTVAACAQRLIERIERQQAAARLRQHHEDIEIEGQHRLDIERRTHRPTDGIAAYHPRAHEVVQDLQRSFHVLLSLCRGANGIRTYFAFPTIQAVSYAEYLEKSTLRRKGGRVPEAARQMGGPQEWLMVDGRWLMA